MNFGIDLLTACNLTCPHCMSHRERSATLPRERVELLLAEIATLGVDSVTFSGGEATMRKDLPQLVSVASSLGMKVSLFTNGTFLEKHWRYIKDTIASLATSIDGRPEYHNTFRGDSNSFQAAVRALDLAVDAGIHAVAQCSVTNDNWTDLDFVTDTALQHQASSVVFQPTLPYGRALADGRHTVLLPERYGQLLQYVMKNRGTMIGNAAISTSLTPTISVRKHPCKIYAVFGKGCHANAMKPPTQFTICADGEVLPLDGHFHKSYSAGNILRTSLSFLMDAYYSSFQNRAFLALCRDTFETSLNDWEPEAISVQGLLTAQSFLKPAGFFSNYAKVSSPFPIITSCSANASLCSE